MDQVTILVVDDEPNVRAGLAQTLRAPDTRIIEAEGPVAALCLLRTEPVGIVISDHLMPEMTGLEFLSLVRDRHPDVLRIMLTGHADLSMALEALNDGQLFRFLEKPCSPTELRVTIHLARERLALERENRHLLSIVRSNPEILKQVRVEELRRGTRTCLRAEDCR